MVLAALSGINRYISASNSLGILCCHIPTATLDRENHRELLQKLHEVNRRILAAFEATSRRVVAGSHLRLHQVCSQWHYTVIGEGVHIEEPMAFSLITNNEIF